MLHTLNKAWAEILIRKVKNKQCRYLLFVAKDIIEIEKYDELFRKEIKVISKNGVILEENKHFSNDGLLIVQTLPTIIQNSCDISKLSEANTAMVIVTGECIKDGCFDNLFETIEMFDDILISDKIHDCMLLDFLGRHCTRKCC